MGHKQRRKVIFLAEFCGRVNGGLGGPGGDWRGLGGPRALRPLHPCGPKSDSWPTMTPCALIG